MDSFRYLNVEENTIKTYPENYHRHLSYSTGELPEQITYVCSHCGHEETIDCTDELNMVYSCYNDAYYCEECSWYCDICNDYFEINDMCLVTDKNGIKYEMPLSWLQSNDNDKAIKENDK